MSSYPEARLCMLCEHALSNHWVAKQSIQPKCTNQEGNNAEDENASVVDSEASYSDDFYEAPDWVITMPVGETTPHGSEDHRSPPHHSIAGLEESATHGCYLCTIFWDKVRDEIRQLTAKSKQSIGRLSSFVIARPNKKAGFKGDIIDLELAFFIDGLIEPGAYVMTVGIFLYKLLRRSLT
jgi:hypothetical protein